MVPYIPQSLLDSLGTDMNGALSGSFTPAKDPWQGYTPQVTPGPAPGSSEWNSSQGWKDVLSTAVKAAGNPTTPAAQNPFGGNSDMLKLIQEMQQGYATQMQDMQKSTASMFDTFGKSLGANAGASYNPTGAGGSFSNYLSPVYRPNGDTDNGPKPVNGAGGSFAPGSNGPFRSTF